jgi:thiol-disulfide isomerase/thioredoxin
MSRRNPILGGTALLVLAICSICRAEFKQGDPLPDLNAYKLQGAVPETLKGKVILLDFWASWCGPCKKSFPAMQELHKQYAEKGLVIIAVSVDEKPDAMQRFVEAANVSFVTVRDASQKLVAAADVATMPTSFLVDRTGKIRYIHRGFAGDETVKAYKEQVELLLKESAKEISK